MKSRMFIFILFVFVLIAIQSTKSNPPSTKLYLCSHLGIPIYPDSSKSSIVTENYLTETPCREGIKGSYLFKHSSSNHANRQNFSFELKSDILGGEYEISLDLASAEEITIKVEMSIILINSESETVIARGDVDVSSAEFKRYQINIDGIDPQAQKGDRLVLRIKNLSDSFTGLMQSGNLDLGTGIEQCYIKVPWKI